jgi:hypothetical protein
MQGAHGLIAFRSRSKSTLSRINWTDGIIEQFQRANSSRGYASLFLAYYNLTLEEFDAAVTRLQNAVRLELRDQQKCDGAGQIGTNFARGIL